MNAESFREHFATFAEAPNGIEKLRELILQLAVQGKFVPQDTKCQQARDQEIPLGELLSEESLNGYSKAPSNSPSGIPILRISAGTSLRIMFEEQVETARANLSLTNMKHFLVPVPPLAEQKRIVAKVTELLTLCDALEAKLTHAEAASSQLLSSAVHHLLKGEPT